MCSNPSTIIEHKHEVELRCIRVESSCLCCDVDKEKCLFEDKEVMFIIKKCDKL